MTSEYVLNSDGSVSLTRGEYENLQKQFGFIGTEGTELVKRVRSLVNGSFEGLDNYRVECMVKLKVINSIVKTSDNPVAKQINRIIDSHLNPTAHGKVA